MKSEKENKKNQGASDGLPVKKKKLDIVVPRIKKKIEEISGQIFIAGVIPSEKSF